MSNEQDSQQGAVQTDEQQDQAAAPVQGTDTAPVADTDNAAAPSAPTDTAPVTEPVVEQKPAPVAPPAPVVEKPVSKKMSDVTVEEYVLIRNKPQAEISKSTKNIIERMNRYVFDMAPGKVMGATDGGNNQRDLYYTIMTAIQGKEEDVKPSLDAICWFFMKFRKECFAERYAFRFMDTVRLDRNEAQSFQYLVRVLVSACDPASRAIALKQIDMGRASSKITDLQARDNFLKYFLG